jgi:hypothetical protein
MLQAKGCGLMSTAKTPFPSTTYCPETDMLHEWQMWCWRSVALPTIDWCVEMGRRFGQIDIYATVALLSQQLALQQVGHLEVAVYYIFA